MSMFSICKHTIQESGHRKSTDNVAEIYCDNVYVKMSENRAFGMLVAGNSVSAL